MTAPRVLDFTLSHPRPLPLCSQVDTCVFLSLLSFASPLQQPLADFLSFFTQLLQFLLCPTFACSLYSPAAACTTPQLLFPFLPHLAFTVSPLSHTRQSLCVPCLSFNPADWFFFCLPSFLKHKHFTLTPCPPLQPAHLTFLFSCLLCPFSQVWSTHPCLLCFQYSHLTHNRVTCLL